MMGGVVCMCFLEMGRWWPNGSCSFSFFFAFLLWAGQDDGVVMFFVGGE